MKPEFWGDEKLAPLSPLTRLVFLGLISMADDCGRVVDNVKVIDAFIFPESSETCRGSVDDLSAMRRLRRGKTASGQKIIEITNWSAHQKIEKPNFKGALPPIETETQAQQEVTGIPRRVGEESGKDRGGVGEESQNHTIIPTTNDPHTNDQRPFPESAKKPRTRARGGERPVPLPHWVTELHVWWTANIGAVAPGLLGKHIKPLIGAYSPAQIQAAAEVYFSPDEGPRYRTPADFATNFVLYHRTAETPVVHNGQVTERGAKIMAYKP